jgi:hypothetical protein
VIHLPSCGSNSRGTNGVTSSIKRARNSSSATSPRAFATIANRSVRSPLVARLIKAGTSLRLVRSPDAPKITMTHGSAGRGGGWTAASCS